MNQTAIQPTAQTLRRDAPIAASHHTAHPKAVRSCTTTWSRWLVVVLFAVAMAWVEAAVVYYLRTMIDRIEPYQPTPLPIAGGLGRPEMVRELATLIMIFSVGLLAGATWRQRFGYMAVVFGIWDIFYYVFLKVMCDWPRSLGDWDILFLLPLPWWGPVWAPVAIAALMLLWGTLASQLEHPALALAPNWKAWLLNLGGIALALYVFMADAIRMAEGGVPALREMLPERFNTALFLVALVLMAAPLAPFGHTLYLRPQTRSANTGSDREGP